MKTQTLAHAPAGALLLGMTTLALLASSCSTLSIDKNRVKESQKVALIGFCVRQQLPKTALDQILNGDDKSGTMGMNAEFCEDKSHATKMYQDFTVTLAKDFGLQVMDDKTLKANPAYKELHKKYTEGWQHRPPARNGMTCYRAEGILDPFHIRNLSLEERKTIMGNLGVDRIAVAEVNANIENSNVLKGLVGAADYSTETIMLFEMYTADDKKAIWQDTHAKGKASKETVGGVLGFTAGNALEIQTVEAAKSSYQALIQRAKKAEN